MAKLPTLNVDVKVNTRTMQKDIAEANKRLQQIGGKGAALVGGGIGKLGSLGSLGGGLGAGALGVAGIAAAAMAPFKLGRMAVNSFADATQRATDALEKLESGKITSTYRETGVAETFTRRLAMGAEYAKGAEAAGKGIMDTMWGSMSDEYGRLGGVGGFIVEEYGKGGGEALKESAAAIGSMLAGESFEESNIKAAMATSANPDAYRRELREAQVRRESGETVSFTEYPISYTVDMTVQMMKDLFS